MIDVSRAASVLVGGWPPRDKGAAWAGSAPSAGDTPPVVPPTIVHAATARRDDAANRATASGLGRVAT